MKYNRLPQANDHNYLVDNTAQTMQLTIQPTMQLTIQPPPYNSPCGFSRPVCFDKVGSDVICLINGLTTSSSALIRAKLIVNRLTVWTFSLRAKSCDKTALLAAS